MGNYENLRLKTDNQLKIALMVLSEMVPCSSRDNTIQKIKDTLEKRKYQVGVFISTGCGEEHHVKPTQEVKKIMLNGEKIYPVPSKCFFNEPQCLEDVKKMVEFLHGGKWGFSTNTDKTTYESLKEWVRTEPENVVIVPWAFCGSHRNYSCSGLNRGVYKDDIKLGGNSVWVRCLESTVIKEET